MIEVSSFHSIEYTINNDILITIVIYPIGIKFYISLQFVK